MFVLRFSAGLSQPAAKPIAPIRRNVMKTQRAKAAENHQMDKPSQKCNPNKIHAGMDHVKCRSKLSSRQSKKLPPLFIGFKTHLLKPGNWIAKPLVFSILTW